MKYNNNKVKSIIMLLFIITPLTVNAQQSPFDSSPPIVSNNVETSEGKYVTFEDLDMMMNDMRTELQYIVSDRIDKIDTGNIESIDGSSSERKMEINGKGVILNNSKYVIR